MFTVFGFYKFKKIKFLKKYKSLFQKEIFKNNVRGTIILSSEGINGTIAGKKDNISKTIKVLKSQLRLKDSSQRFDLIFIDADKENYLKYYETSMDLINKNGLIVIDNVLWHGEVIDDTKNDKFTNIRREFNTHNKKDSRVANNIFPIGDGLTICIKK